jgi:SAM-dependent methyltransferase
VATAYDEIAYPTVAFRQTHPDRLATQAALFGLPFAPVSRCRVLDIGCGDGANLIPMAVAYPDARFIGFDLSGNAIARGQQVIAALSLTNIRLETCDVMEADFGAGAFDYVIAHGLYAWIPEAARDALLASTRRHLAPGGVAFVSYNALPGGRIRQIMREMLLFQIRDVVGAAARFEAARREAQAFVDAYSDADPHQRLIKAELREMLERPAAVLAHDDLGEVYEPVYLHQFLDHAGRRGLQYLTEATLGRCGEGFRPESALDDPTFDVPASLQRLDFRVLRSYRENLLVHADVPLDRRPAIGRMSALFASAPVHALEDEPDVFDIGQKRAQLTDAGLQRIVARIGAAWPAAIAVADLDLDEDHAGALLRMYWSGLIELHTEPFGYSTAVPSRPVASPLARLQAAAGGPRLTTLRHTTVEIGDPIGLRFIAGLDGARTIDQVAADMAAEFDLPVDGMKQQVLTKLGDLVRLALLT